MAYVTKQNLANRSNYGDIRDVKDIKYIVIHYTSNDGDTDENNGKYYASGYRGASAHLYVDDDSVTISVPDNYVAWSVGGNKWNDTGVTGGGKYYGKCTNANSLSIEICDDVKNGVVKPSAATIDNAVALCKEKMKQYDVPVDRVIRHFDVNGKHCPAYWCCSDSNNKLWMTEFKNRLTETIVTNKSTTTTSNSTSKKPQAQWIGLVNVKVGSTLNVRNNAGTDDNCKILFALKKNTEVLVYSSKIGTDGKKWFYISYNGKFGYVRSDYIVKLSFIHGGYDYSFVFNPIYYVEKYPDLMKTFGYNGKKLFSHFLSHGMKEGRKAIANFDVSVYKKNYSDLQKAFKNNLVKYYQHYIKYGIKEKRKAV